MARTRKPKTISIKKTADPVRAAQVRRILLHTLGSVAVVLACAGGIHLLRHHVERRVVFPDRPAKIVLVNRPAWMSDFLAEQIIRAVRPAGIHSTFDHQVLVDVGTILRTNPWVKEVRQVRRAFDKKPGDTIEIDCEYRAPIALVHWKDYFWLVDGEAVKLPEQFTQDQLPRIVMGPNRKLNIRVIEGVQQAPVESGQKWAGADLEAGLDLVRLLHGQPYAEEIVKVDVSNFAGRNSQKDAQIVLVTKYGTEIRWGRPINSRDFFVEVSANQKLKYMQQVYEQFHRVDGNFPWIDIRFDKITYPSAPTAQLDDRQ
jgi:hypothetical protein